MVHASSYDFRRLNNKSSTKGARAASANIASIDDGSLDALPKEEASELVGAERYERKGGGPGDLPQRPLREKAHHGRRGTRVFDSLEVAGLSVGKFRA